MAIAGKKHVGTSARTLLWMIEQIDDRADELMIELTNASAMSKYIMNAWRRRCP
ncbi:MAG: hypothetical protein ACLP19_25435 [Xanthobacteraceae bacterium]